MSMSKSVYIAEIKTDEECALWAEAVLESGAGPVLVHRTSSASADAVVRYLMGRPSGVAVRRSPDTETVKAFEDAIAANPRCIHVYFEQVCDVCGSLPPLFHTSVAAGFFCRSCAENLVGGAFTAAAGAT